MSAVGHRFILPRAPVPAGPLASDWRAFSWTIGELGQKIANAKMSTHRCIHSNAFYSDIKGYRMCLVVYPNGRWAGEGSHLSVGFVIVRGSFDDTVPWPMDRKVSIALIDGRHGIVRRATVLHCDSAGPEHRHCFDRPQGTINDDYCIDQFFDYRLLLSAGDSIVLRCSVD